jgi:hypothetical protein
MSDPNDWYRVLTLARSNAAQDLSVSNDLLAIVDEMVNMSEKGALTEEKVRELSESIVKCALRLTDQSKQMSVSVSKLVGVI